MSNATVAGLFIAPSKSAPMTSLAAVEAVQGEGLAGDRYAIGAGFYSGKPGWGAQVTFIAREAIDAVNAGHLANFTPEMLRRNVVTKGIELSSLVGRNFSCGAAVLRGTKPFPPCLHLAQVIGRRDVLKYFAFSSGIGAEVVEGGVIRIGDAVALIE